MVPQPSSHHGSSSKVFQSLPESLGGTHQEQLQKVFQDASSPERLVDGTTSGASITFCAGNDTPRIFGTSSAIYKPPRVWCASPTQGTTAHPGRCEPRILIRLSICYSFRRLYCSCNSQSDDHQRVASSKEDQRLSQPCSSRHLLVRLTLHAEQKSCLGCDSR